MSTGRPCSICSSVRKTRTTLKMIAAGATDQAIAGHLGGGLHRMAVSRHRRLHVEEPARAVAEMAGKGREARQQREEQQAAVERGDPLAIFKLDSIASDISRIAQRLDSSVGEAAAAGQHGGHAALAGQLLRQAELRARLGGHDRAPATGHDAAPFSVTLVFSGAGKTERVTTGISVTEAQPRTIDAGRGDIEDRMLNSLEPSKPSKASISPLAKAFSAGSQG